MVRRRKKRKSTTGKKIVLLTGSLVLCVVTTAFVCDTKMKDEIVSVVNQTLDLNFPVTVPELKEVENLNIVEKFEAIRKKNIDTIGWIRVENTSIDYPIMFKDNSSYLYNDYNGVYNFSGSIFLDESCNGNLENVILLHGHNMKDGTMFGSIKKFLNGSIPKDSIIELYNGNEILEFEVFSMFYYDVDKMLITTTFRDENSYKDYLKELASLGNSTIDPNYNKEVIVMSTCADTSGSGRLAIVAKRK